MHDIAVGRAALRAGAGTDRFVLGELMGFEIARGVALRTTWNAAWQDAARRRFRFWR